MPSRDVKCNLHGRTILGHGTTQVYRKVVFNFCVECWTRRRDECGALMALTAGPAPGIPETERSAERGLQPIDLGGMPERGGRPKAERLPESLERYLAECGDEEAASV